MQKSIGVFGSIAFDHLYPFEGQIRDFLAAQDPKNVSISLFCKDRTVHYGGCGGNIAHTLASLGVPTTLFGTVGHDAQEYIHDLSTTGVAIEHLSFTDLPTATASIVTDRNQDQYALFYAGALGASARPALSDSVLATLSCLIVSPEDPGRFAYMVERAVDAKLPYYCDPGQVITILPEPFLKKAIANAAGLFCNAYECDLIAQKLKTSSAKLTASVPLALITHGKNGVTLYENGTASHFPAVPAEMVRNVTGCGDAFRAGFLAGLSKNLPFAVAAQLGTLIATFVAESSQPQISDFSLPAFRTRYQSHFGTVCPL